MDSTKKADSPGGSHRSALRTAARATSIGNFVEYFDYACYGYFATEIGAAFFPEDDGGTALAKTFGLFALSFLVRPLGGVFWGHIGDRISRKAALSLSIAIMSAATFLVALLPDHAAIGMAAPLLLLVLRLVQGFSAAGEYAGASVFLFEQAPPSRRGRYTALVPASTAAGLLFGSALAAALSWLLDGEQLQSWGWRLPFLLAGPLGLAGRFLRLRLEGALQAQAQACDQEPERVPIREVMSRPGALLAAFVIAAMNAVGFYVVLGYLPSYLTEEAGVGKTASSTTTTIALAVYIAFVLFAGESSDRVGRRWMLLASAGLFVMLSVPAFMLLRTGEVVVVAAVQILLGGVLALNDGTLPSALAERFPPSVRYTGFALAFNTANAAFGGTAPFVATLLVQRTGSNLAPAWYLVAVALATMVGVLATLPSAAQQDGTMNNRKGITQ